jgi:hypothetical protein
MIKGAGVILQGRMQIGLRRMAGVAGFTEQCQISQAQLGDQSSIGQQARLVGYGQLPGMAKNQDDQHTEQRQHQKGKGGRATH